MNSPSYEDLDRRRHPTLGAGVRRLLAGDLGAEIAEAGFRRKEALSLVKKRFSFQADLLILDLNMRGVGDLEFIDRLKREARPPLILVPSMYEDPVYAKRAPEAGANGCVTKNASVAQIVEAMARKQWRGLPMARPS